MSAAGFAIAPKRIETFGFAVRAARHDLDPFWLHAQVFELPARDPGQAHVRLEVSSPEHAVCAWTNGFNLHCDVFGDLERGLRDVGSDRGDPPARVAAQDPGRLSDDGADQPPPPGVSGGHTAGQGVGHQYWHAVGNAYRAGQIRRPADHRIGVALQDVADGFVAEQLDHLCLVHLRREVKSFALHAERFGRAPEVLLDGTRFVAHRDREVEACECTHRHPPFASEEGVTEPGVGEQCAVQQSGHPSRRLRGTHSHRKHEAGALFIGRGLRFSLLTGGAQMQPADPFLDQTILGGQFQITKKIGTGGMGSVYQANQVDMNRSVAIKILHPKLATRKDLASRFRREARAMSQLTHPNTVKVFMYGQLDEGAVGGGSLFIVMEYLEGRNLNRAVKRDGPMGLPKAAAILIQVCGALQEAHNMGIVHRDLKPENIFLCRQGEIQDYPKVLDFGLAKVTERQMRPGSIQLTQEGMVFGTPEFMSPEQAQGKTLDARSDIYSLAVILYEALTGKLPFEARTPMEYIQKHVVEAPIPINQRVPEYQFPPQLWDALGRAMAKSPDARHQSAIEFAHALRPFAEVSPAVDAIFQMTPGPPMVRSPDSTPQSAPLGRASVPQGSGSTSVPAPARESVWVLVGVAAVFLILGAALAIGVLLLVTR